MSIFANVKPDDNKAKLYSV